MNIGNFIMKYIREMQIGGARTKKFAFVCIMAVMLLSGCSGMEKQIIQLAGIGEDENYKKYIELQDAGKLDQEGLYKDADGIISEDASDSLKDGIHVSFATNSCLDIQYYWDSELTDPIDTAVCYLKPNGCIYAKEPECKSAYGNFFSFDGFRIYEYDGERNQRKELFWDEGSSNLMVQIPVDYNGTEIIIEPVGKYEKHTLVLEDYYTDNDGNEQELQGQWFINGKETWDKDMEISPATSYIVDYRYDADKYEFVSSEPYSFSHENGYVQFETAEAGDLIEKYSVRLRPIGQEFPLKIILTDSVQDILFSLYTLGEMKQTDIQYDTGEKTSIRPDWLGGTDRLVFDQQVRMGSDVTISAESGTLLQEYSLKLDVVKTDTEGNEHESVEYISSLPGKGLISLYGKEAGMNSTITYGEMKVTISKVETISYESKTIPNASVEVCLADIDNSSALQKGDILENSREVRITVTPDKGCYITGSDVENNVYSDTMSYAEWLSDANEIFDSHKIKKFLSVTLDNSDKYGTCVYKLDGEVVSGTIQVRDDQELMLEYKITDSAYQIASGNPISGLISKIQPQTSKTQTISLSEISDGDVIRRSDYIEIEKRGD